MIAGVTEESQRRWYAIKLFERDQKVMVVSSSAWIRKAKLEAIISADRGELDDDAESIITDARYQYIGGIVQGLRQKKKTGMAVSVKRSTIS